MIRDTFVTEREQLLWTISWVLSGLAGVIGGMGFWVAWTVGWFSGFLVLAILMKNKNYTEELDERLARLEQRVPA
jgi:hypothetical protein